MRKKVFANKPGFTQIKSKKTAHRIRRKFKKYLCLFVIICGVMIFLSFEFNQTLPKVSAGNKDEIENAIYTRTEFFGTEAIVLVPTKEARENLLKLHESSPDDRKVLEKLAEYNQKLWRFDEAEKNLIKLAEIDFSKNELLANFYNARGEYKKEAEIYRKMLFAAETKKRPQILEILLDLARNHDLREYLQTEFYRKIADENSNYFPIYEKILNALTEEKKYAEALDFLRQMKNGFPAEKDFLLEKEIEFLLEINQNAEAEKIYIASFDPFWSRDNSDKFYSFLSGQDKLRIYGADVRNRFRKNPSDFDAAIRLADYQNNDYEYGNDDVSPIFLKLEVAKKSWTTDELLTVTRILLKHNQGETASRFLYTLVLREEFKNNSGLRAKILYQLFELFSDADEQKLPLTKGDLRFYEDVAQSDTRTGIATGILSLIFSDTDPREKLSEQEGKSAKLFNRAAAYRIFQEYKKEVSTSPELAQMYLDVVRFYTAIGNTEIAEKTLEEFSERYENTEDFPSVALKLADAFIVKKENEKARRVYQKILDRLGKKRQPLFQSETQNEEEVIFSETSRESANSRDEIVERNIGINIPNPEKTPSNDYYYENGENKFHDYVGRENEKITYGEVLEKYVSSLAAEEKTLEILALYSAEISKYPDEEKLYELRLSRLVQNDIADEQLQVYKTALARFQNATWRDKLARFFLRENRNAEFAEFAEDLIGKLDDEETKKFLYEFINSNTNGKNFSQYLYLKLYLKAHQRFPHNIHFINGLLQFYKSEERFEEWRKLSAENYFELSFVRQDFLQFLSKNDELRGYLQKAKNSESPIYALFRADAAAYLSDFENAVETYRKLNEIYPNTTDFENRLTSLTRSFGQKDRKILGESAKLAQSQADYYLSNTGLRTQSGEIFAEFGDYQKARSEWAKIIATARGTREIYLETATVYWDYFQYGEALQTINFLREKFNDETLYSFEAGAISEAQKNRREAFAEYVKALGSTDADLRQKTAKRLKTLSEESRNPNSKLEQNDFLNQFDAVYQNEFSKQRKGSLSPLGYAEFLVKIRLTERAESVLTRAVNRSFDAEFAEAALEFFETENNLSGEQEPQLIMQDHMQSIV